ncbi:hypothetical protein MMC25_007637 [Agyrium rufum]|nr:hypothetical protein [Agyrium rufum]
MDASSINPTRTQHACRPCRDLKVKCHPCPKGGDVCKKCQRSGASCIIEEPKQRRKRKAPDDRITVSVLEGKLAELAKQLETKNDRLYPQHDIKSSICSSFQGNLPQGIIDYAADYVPMADSGAHISGHSSPDKIESLVDQLLGQGCLKASTAESYLAKYQQMCAYFPFVPISEKATVRSLRQTQPFLLHAILAVSSRENQGLQHVLDRKLREDLLKAVIMDGEKSIDLLQAFLVYLAWEQFFYVPKKRHTNQMLQIAASLCVEMGLDLGPREASVRKFGLHLDHHFSAGGTGDDLFFSKPARRAYLATSTMKYFPLQALTILLHLIQKDFTLI